MTSVELAQECLAKVEPLLKMIRDDDEKHMGQLLHNKADKTVGDALASSTKLLKSVNAACGDLKKKLMKCEEKKIDRTCDEGILIHMVLKGTILLKQEIARLKKLKKEDELVDRYFPTDVTGAEIRAIQQLIKRRNGDADAESVGSMISMAEEKSADDSSVSEPTVVSAVLLEPSVAEKSEPVQSVAEKDEKTADATTEKETNEKEQDTTTEETTTTDETKKEDTTTTTTADETTKEDEKDKVEESGKEEKSAKDESESISALIEEASAILDTPDVAIDYSNMSADDLQKAAKKLKTHAQKDVFIAALIDLIRKGKPVVVEPVIVDVADASLDLSTNTAETSADSSAAASSTAASTESVAAPATASAEPTFTVEDVSKFTRTRDGVVEVLVKWKNYPIEKMTWEPKTEELSKKNVNGSFFESGDTSFKKFCARISGESCTEIAKKDTEKCEKEKGKEKCKEQVIVENDAVEPAKEEDEQETALFSEGNEDSTEYAKIPTPVVSDSEDETSSSEAELAKSESIDENEASAEKATVESVSE